MTGSASRVIPQPSTKRVSESPAAGPGADPLAWTAVSLTSLLIAVIPVEDALKVGTLSISHLAGYMAFAVTGLYLLAVGSIRLDVRMAFLIALYEGWVAASYYWSAAPADTALFSTTAVELGLLVMVTWQLIAFRGGVELAMGALAAGGLVGCVISFNSTVSAHTGVPRYAV